MLIEGERRMTESGVEVWLAALNPGVLATVRNTGLDARLGRERMLFNARAAIERYQARQATDRNKAESAPSRQVEGAVGTPTQDDGGEAGR